MLKRDELGADSTCMRRARDDEMVFVLLGRDAAAPAAIRSWVEERIRLRKNNIRDEQIQEALRCADHMEWVSRAVEKMVRPKNPCTSIVICDACEIPIAYRQDHHEMPGGIRLHRSCWVNLGKPDTESEYREACWNFVEAKAAQELICIPRVVAGAAEESFRDAYKAAVAAAADTLGPADEWSLAISEPDPSKCSHSIEF